MIFPLEKSGGEPGSLEDGKVIKEAPRVLPLYQEPIWRETIERMTNIIARAIVS